MGLTSKKIAIYRYKTSDLRHPGLDLVGEIARGHMRYKMRIWLDGTGRSLAVHPLARKVALARTTLRGGVRVRAVLTEPAVAHVRHSLPVRIRIIKNMEYIAPILGWCIGPVVGVRDRRRIGDVRPVDELTECERLGAR